jgi:uncharacterized membrane protein YcaP (DUF421 family)
VFFRSWNELGHVALITALAFGMIVAIRRVVGAQAIARMSGYDMVATVTLGSIVATVALTRGTTVSDGVVALLTLVAMQEIIRFAQSRWLPAHHAVRQAPVVVLWDGALLEDRLRENRISADEVRAVVRRHGLASLSDARVVVLENDGNWSVVPNSAQIGDDSALYGLPVPGRAGNSPDADGEFAERAPDNRLP